MEWYWWLALIFGYVAGAVYFGTRFREWGRHALCTYYPDSNLMCGACSFFTGFSVIMWPVLPPLIMLITWLYRTAKDQSKMSPAERQRKKRRALEEKAEAEQRAIAAERKTVAARTQLVLEQQALQHAQNMLASNDFVQPDFSPKQ